MGDRAPVKSGTVTTPDMAGCQEAAAACHNAVTMAREEQ
jgi:hypothetical protein